MPATRSSTAASSAWRPTQALGLIDGAVTVASGATLQWATPPAASRLPAKTLTLNGQGFGNVGALPLGALYNGGNQANTWTGNVLMTGAGTAIGVNDGSHADVRRHRSAAAAQWRPDHGGDRQPDPVGDRHLHRGRHRQRRHADAVQQQRLLRRHHRQRRHRCQQRPLPGRHALSSARGTAGTRPELLQLHGQLRRARSSSTTRPATSPTTTSPVSAASAHTPRASRSTAARSSSWPPTPANTASSQTVGTITLGSGQSTIQAGYTATAGVGDTSVLTSAGLVRNPGATVVFSSGSDRAAPGHDRRSSTADNQLIFTTAPTLDNGILPYAAVDRPRRRHRLGDVRRQRHHGLRRLHVGVDHRRRPRRR